MGEKGTGEKEKAAFVPYELFIQSSNEVVFDFLKYSVYLLT